MGCPHHYRHHSRIRIIALSILVLRAVLASLIRKPNTAKKVTNREFFS